MYKKLFEISTKKKGIEFSVDNEIGYGFYVGHPYGITINAKAIIGNNVNIHKGVTIGQENRGKRKGTLLHLQKSCGSAECPVSCQTRIWTSESVQFLSLLPDCSG